MAQTDGTDAWCGLGDLGATATLLVALLVALSLAASGPAAGAPFATGPTQEPLDGPTHTSDDGKTHDNTSGASDYRLTEYDFPMPDKEVVAERRAEAFDAALQNRTVQRLRRGSFVFQPDYQYRPNSDVVTYRTWHDKRVEGDWRSEISVHFVGGYAAQLVVDADSREITAFRLSERQPTTVTKSYTEAEKAAVSTALGNATVASELEGVDYYVSMVRNSVTFEEADCGLDSCYLVVFKRTTGEAHVTVHVDQAAGEVVDVVTEHWSMPAPEPPAVDASEFPDVESEVAGENAGRRELNAITKHNWNVEYTVTNDNGIRIDDGEYNGNQVFFDERVPHVHVRYPDGTHIEDPLSDGDLDHGPHVHDFSNGFMVHGTFYIGCSASEWPTSGCYKYDQEWRFDGDGTFEPWFQIYGPGFADSLGNPDYETPFRIDSDVRGAFGDAVKEYTSSGWDTVFTEDNFPADSTTDSDGNKWRVQDLDSGADIFVDPYSPDDADFWVLRYEGTDDDHPGDLDDDEDVYDEDVMQYYVAHNEDCMPDSPCYPGGWWDAGEVG